jgi:hypothetical protein
MILIRGYEKDTKRKIKIKEMIKRIHIYQNKTDRR